MWIFESDGPALQGKKLWLRPGKKFLFGRTTAETGDARSFAVEDKTISRKHLTVQVESVKEGACAKPNTRSKVILTDLNTKIGTLVDGDQIRGKSHELTKDVNVVTLGKYKYRFIFTWVPVTLTFSFTNKELKQRSFEHLYELLGPLDMKVIPKYERGNTTHIVTKKRNTSKGLQALIDGKHIVHNDSFIQALVKAATPVEEDGPSPLEVDFEAGFPDALKYLPPKGEEPTTRDDDAYAPDERRRDMFDGYTFIFMDRRQFDNLLAPITDGHGKALLREALPDQTTVEDFVGYVKNVAGEKGLGEFEDGSEGKGVVVVRFNPKGDGTEWYGEFGRQVALHLDHRLIEQNEFLDAILGADAKVLRRPLEVESSSVVAPSGTAVTNTSSQTLRGSDPVAESAPAPTPAQMAPPEPSRRGRSRRTARPEFKGFDDDFSSMPLQLNSIPEAEPMVIDPTPPIVEESQSQNLFVSQDTPIEFPPPDPSQYSQSQAPRSSRRRHVSATPEPQPQPSQTQTQRSSRKRSVPPTFDEDDSLTRAPAAAALKKRRLEEAAERKRRGISTPPPDLRPVIKESPKAKTPPKRKTKKQDIAPDVGDALELAKQKREQEEKAKKEQEALQQKMGSMEISKIRNPFKVSEMEVREERPVRRAVAHADEDERWDDKWNARKNFKRFRQKGGDGERRVYNRVIVPLVEVKKLKYGVGEGYWGGDDASQGKKKKDKGKGKETQDLFSQADTQQNKKANKKSAEMEVRRLLAREAEEIGEEEDPNIMVDEDGEDEEPVQKPQRGRKVAASQVVEKGRKRTATTALAKPAPAKRARQVVEKEESEDSEDDLKFKFKKRG